jgi:hypothetical protein
MNELLVRCYLSGKAIDRMSCSKQRSKVLAGRKKEEMPERRG